MLESQFALQNPGMTTLIAITLIIVCGWMASKFF